MWCKLSSIRNSSSFFLISSKPRLSFRSGARSRSSRSNRRACKPRQFDLFSRGRLSHVPGRLIIKCTFLSWFHPFLPFSKSSNSLRLTSFRSSRFVSQFNSFATTYYIHKLLIFLIGVKNHSSCSCLILLFSESSVCALEERIAIPSTCIAGFAWLGASSQLHFLCKK